MTNCDKNTDHKKSDILGKSCAHRSTKACENVPDRGAKSVPFHIHRELKIEADLKIICLDDGHFLDLICCLCAGSLTEKVLLCYIKLVKSVEPLVPALKTNCGPPTANLWSDWSPQKRVNHDKLNQRQKVRKSSVLY